MTATAVHETVDRIVAACRTWEFRSFVVGLPRSPQATAAPPSSSKRLIGLELLRRWPFRRVEFRRPEARLEVQADGSVRIVTAPLFVAGRYRKLSREIPASRWIHHRCRGKGCPECGGTGELNGPSVEELLCGPLLERTGGESARLHALGREDTDARMLGRGRPFIIEVRRPRRRRVPWTLVLDEVERRAEGRATWVAPAFVCREDVPRLKESAAEKTYRAWVETAAAPPPDAARRIASLTGRVIEQLSPTRVMGRRGRNSMRRKRIAASRWLGEVDGRWVWEVRAESGTYIKELVSGDGGRTRPSLTTLLEVPARCTALDVLAIHWRGPWEPPSTT